MSNVFIEVVENVHEAKHPFKEVPLTITNHLNHISS